MGRAFVALALCVTVLSAVGLYFIKYDTRQISFRAQELERQIEKTQSDISLLRAEVGALAHPDRLERLAKKNSACVRCARIRCGNWRTGHLPMAR